MNNFRIKKLEKEILNKIYIILFKKLNDNRIKDINITKINLCKDLSFAKIYFIFIKSYNINKYIKILNNSSNFFRKELFKSLNIKFIPKLLFIYDFDIIKSRKVLNIINSIKYY